MNKTPVEKHFDKIAGKYDFYTAKRDLHYSTLKELLHKLIPKGTHVFEIGCGTGDLLASLKPNKGYGMDISSEMIKIANIKYSTMDNLRFSVNWPTKEFDYIFMSDVIEHLENPLNTFKQVAKLMNTKSKFICTMMNPVWIPVETVYNRFGWKMPEGPSKRIKYGELNEMIQESGLKAIEHDYKLLMPIKMPFYTFINKYLEKPLKRFAFIEYIVAERKEK